MLTRSTHLRSWFFLLAMSGSQAAFAQNSPQDSLNGRIVHVYLPSNDVDTLMPVNNMGDVPMAKKDYWYTATLRGGPNDQNDGFFFTTPGRRMNLSRSGFQNAEGQRFQKSDFRGKNEIWIIMDPALPLSSPPKILLEPPKIVNILNPWETTGPRLVLPGGRKSMVTVPGHCGWFMAFLLDAGDTKLHFEEINNTATYGRTGLAAPAADYDIAAEFAAKGTPAGNGTQLWLDTDINTWLPTYPNKDGNCQYMMAATVRDFSKDHPDFDHPAASYVVVKGMVQPAIGIDGVDRRPVRSTKTAPWPIFNDFNSWWKTDSLRADNAKFRSYETCVDIPMSKSNDGLWEYDSYATPDRGYYPIDNFNRFNETLATQYQVPSTSEWRTLGVHNMNFCMESHAKFIYQKGQKFEFRGDDDVWVFINDKLVIDLGGLHIPASDTVLLDTLRPALQSGKEYNWDFFYCERQPTGSSLKIKTSIFFRQQKALDTLRLGGTGGSQSFKIIKREGGKGSCAGLGDSLRVVEATNLTYQLWDATGKSVAPLGNGSFHAGSIVIKTAPPNPSAEVTVDTNIVVTDLAPGNYRIVAFDPANQKVRAEIPYKVPARNLVQLHTPTGDTSVPLGALVRVILANTFNGQVVAGAQPYVPVYPPALEVYLDPLKIEKAGPATVFTTDGTGYDTLWVTDTALALADKVHPISVPGTVPTLRITFRVPKVAFLPPFAVTKPLGILVPVVAVNSVPDVPGRYMPDIPAGLDVYQNSDRTGRVTRGATLSTDAAGIDTLWVTGTATATTDQTYVLSIPSSNQVSLTFLFPKNRVEFEDPLARDTLVGSLVRLLAANREAGALVPKAEPYTLIIPAGLEVYTDALKGSRVQSGAVLTSSPDGWDTLWVTADSAATDYADTTFIMEIAASARKMSLTFRMPPLDLPKVLAASIHDDDGDGIGDRIQATYDRDIAANPPKAAAYRWPTGAATAPLGSLTDKISGTTLVHRGAFSTSPLTAGEGSFLSTYRARKRDSTQTVPLVDAIGPILLKAEMILGGAYDTLRLVFSEPIAAAAASGPPGTFFAYKLMPDGAPVAYEPDFLGWREGNTVAALAFKANTIAAAAPRAGNLVRIEDGPGRLADLRGNGAGPASRYRLITGVKRAEIKTLTYKMIEPDPALLQEAPITAVLLPVGTTVGEAVDRTGRLGHLIKTDLGAFAMGDDFVPVNPSQVSLEYAASYFTNHGVPVAEGRGTLACTDAVFQGDCLRNRGYLFVGWNYTARGGTKVGTGAYISRIRFSVKVAGKVKQSGGLDQTWGVLRRN